MTKSPFGISYKFAQANFFDRAKVVRELNKMERVGLSKAGAFVQRRAKSLLKRRKRISKPGETPSVHSTGQASLKKILFIYERKNKGVVIGPVKLNQANQSWIDLKNKTVPELLELGDVVNIKEVSTDGGRTWRRRDLRRNTRFGETYRTRRATYAPRPFMGPALRAEIDAGKIVGAFKNAFGPGGSKVE